MSFFIFPTSTILLPLSLSLFSNAYGFGELVDLDGDLIRNGGEYYILPLTYGDGAITEFGLTFTQRNEQCPLYITPSVPSENKPISLSSSSSLAPESPEDDDSSLGTPVRISTPLRIPFIRLNDLVSLAFGGSDTSALPCQDTSPVWTVTPIPFARTKYVTTGGDQFGDRVFTVTTPFLSFGSKFVLQYCAPYSFFCSDIGISEKSGLLGIAGYSTPIVFKKAFKASYGDEVSFS